MSHTIKIWERIIEAGLKDRVELANRKMNLFISKGNYRCHVCLKNVDGKVQGRSNRATLCIRGPRESLQQGFERRAVVFYEKIRKCINQKIRI